MGFIHIPEIYCNPLPPQMVCTNIRIEWKTLGCTHFPEICFHLPSIWHEYQDKKKIPEIWFHPPNVWHEYQDRIENVAFYAHHRNMFTPPRMFCTNIRIELSISKICVQFNILDSILIFLPKFVCVCGGGDTKTQLKPNIHSILIFVQNILGGVNIFLWCA